MRRLKGEVLITPTPSGRVLTFTYRKESETCNLFNCFKIQAENLTGRQIKHHQTTEFNAFLKLRGSKWQMTMATPEQNVVSEPNNRTFLEMALCRFWSVLQTPGGVLLSC